MLAETQINPWSETELPRIVHAVRNAGYDPQRLARVRPAQIVYSHSWIMGKGSLSANLAAASSAADDATTITLTNTDSSIVTGVRFSVVDPVFAVAPPGPLATSSAATAEWRRGDDPTAFCTARNPLDYISMHVVQTASEQLSTSYVPLSHWEERNRDGYLPSRLDFVPGGNYSSYQLLLRSSKLIQFERLDISITAIKLMGL